MEKARAKKIGQSIRQKRKARGITMKELGGMIGCSEQAISQYERGERRLNVVSLIMIANALQCTPSDLASKEDWDHLRGKTALVGTIKLDNMPDISIGDLPDTSDADMEQLNLDLDEDFQALKWAYLRLNERGKREASVRIHEMMHIPRYRRSPDGKGE